MTPAAALAASFGHNGLSSRARSVVAAFGDYQISRYDHRPCERDGDAASHGSGGAARGSLGEPESARGPASETGRDLAVMQSAARPATVFALTNKLHELQSKIAQEKLVSIFLSNRGRTLDICKANTPISLTPIICFKAGWPMITRKKRVSYYSKQVDSEENSNRVAKRADDDVTVASWS